MCTFNKDCCPYLDDLCLSVLRARFATSLPRQKMLQLIPAPMRSGDGCAVDVRGGLVDRPHQSQLRGSAGGVVLGCRGGASCECIIVCVRECHSDSRGHVRRVGRSRVHKHVSAGLLRCRHGCVSNFLPVICQLLSGGGSFECQHFLPQVSKSDEF